jgi:hypothetical protein
MDREQSQMFSYLSPEMRVRKDHPLRAIWDFCFRSGAPFTISVVE